MEGEQLDEEVPNLEAVHALRGQIEGVDGHAARRQALVDELRVQAQAEVARPEGVDSPEFEQPAARVQEVAIPGGSAPVSGGERQTGTRSDLPPIGP